MPSSRRLEREAQRNVELMWLTGRLAPDFKTIADFRRDNGDGIRTVCRRFVQLCRELKLFTQAIVAIDSSKFKAVNSRDRNFTPDKVDRSRQQQIEESIQRYLDALETADRTQPAEVEAKTERLREKIKTLREQMRRMRIDPRATEEHPRRADLGDRPGRPLDDLAGQGHGSGRLQRAGGGRCQAPPDRDARGHQRRQRPGAAQQDGQRRKDAMGKNGCRPSPTAATSTAPRSRPAPKPASRRWCPSR